jgi:hypothetical protein
MSKDEVMGKRCISSTIISSIIRSSLVQVLEYKQHNEVSNNKIELGVTKELLAGFKIGRVSACLGYNRSYEIQTNIFSNSR